MKLGNAFSLILFFHFLFDNGNTFELNSSVQYETIPILSYSEMNENCEGFSIKRIW